MCGTFSTGENHPSAIAPRIRAKRSTAGKPVFRSLFPVDQCRLKFLFPCNRLPCRKNTETVRGVPAGSADVFHAEAM